MYTFKLFIFSVKRLSLTIHICEVSIPFPPKHNSEPLKQSSISNILLQSLNHKILFLSLILLIYCHHNYLSSEDHHFTWVVTAFLTHSLSFQFTSWTVSRITKEIILLPCLKYVNRPRLPRKTYNDLYGLVSFTSLASSATF